MSAAERCLQHTLGMHLHADAYREFCDFSTRQKTPSAGKRMLLIVGTEGVRNFGKISHPPERMLGQIPDAMRDKLTEIATRSNGPYRINSY